MAARRNPPLADAVSALRSLIAATRRADAPPEVLDEVRRHVEAATAALLPYHYAGEEMQSALRGPNDPPGDDDLEDPANYFPYSPIVGPLNAISPPVVLRFDGDRMRGEMSLGASYAGPPGTVHGGVVALIFDELLGSVNVSHGLGAFTGTLSVRYERPTPLDRTVQLESWIERVEGRKIFTKGTLSCDGTITARADGLFITAAHSTRDGDS
jgi:acyl-coenzyme A thioesterase PaaI-like protein